jgi:chitin deacetylase
MAESGHEVASHSWRWIDYKGMPEAEEREHIRMTAATIREICVAPPLGWYTGRYSQNTRRLVMEETEGLYDSDAYNDDLPYWETEPPRVCRRPFRLSHAAMAGCSIMA